MLNDITIPLFYFRFDTNEYITLNNISK